ncbi:hypothetical protein GCK32_020726 [Trichostrongylus colubriformis]|uniref:Uncharacterized protein n=1 Tax=Trichostrongylus colubriformis TaxID=6319 RepID=A0AAN8G4F9_TRICO
MSSDFGVHQLLMPFDGNQPGPSRMMVDSPTDTPQSADASDLLRLLTEGNGTSHSPKAHLERLLSGVDLPHDISSSSMEIPTTYSMGIDLSMYGDIGCAGALR